MAQKNQDVCPNCGSRDLLIIDGDSFCRRCSWDSCQSSVDGGLLDFLWSVDLPGTDSVGSDRTVQDRIKFQIEKIEA